MEIVDVAEVEPSSPLLDRSRWEVLKPAVTVAPVSKRRAVRADAAQPCKRCRAPLNESIRSRHEDWKSCPKCSIDDGTLHVFLPYPAAFGQSEKRVTSDTPDGAQSWCSSCRLGSPSNYERRLCPKVEK